MHPPSEGMQTGCGVCMHLGHLQRMQRIHQLGSGSSQEGLGMAEREAMGVCLPALPNSSMCSRVRVLIYLVPLS